MTVSTEPSSRSWAAADVYIHPGAEGILQLLSPRRMISHRSCISARRVHSRLESMLVWQREEARWIPSRTRHAAPITNLQEKITTRSSSKDPVREIIGISIPNHPEDDVRRSAMMAIVAKGDNIALRTYRLEFIGVCQTVAAARCDDVSWQPGPPH